MKGKKEEVPQMSDKELETSPLDPEGEQASCFQLLKLRTALENTLLSAEASLAFIFRDLSAIAA